jgi:hypothetical protein
MITLEKWEKMAVECRTISELNNKPWGISWEVFVKRRN